MHTRLVSEYRFDPDNAKKEQLDLVHYGYVCIVDENSNVIFEAGDSEDFVFYRSASKPLQSLPVFKYGLDKLYGLTEKESVILSGSHAGEKHHVEAVENILAKAGFTEDILCMKPTIPGNRKAIEDRIREGVPFRKIFHNCSGKHAALLLIQKYLGGNPDDYWKVDTPVFREVEQVIKQMSETDEVKLGVDGCGVPVFAVGMKNIATAYKNLACPDMIKDESLRNAVIKSTGLIMKHPEMMRGEGLLCTIMNKDPNIIAKGGANGVYGFGLRKQRLGVSFKFVDGTEETWTFLAREILRALGALTPEHEERLNSLRPKYFVNDNDLVVGERRLDFEIK